MRASYSPLFQWIKTVGVQLLGKVKRGREALSKILTRRNTSHRSARVFSSRAISLTPRNLKRGEQLLDPRRRAFLKYAFFGGALFLAGKYTGPLINYFRGDAVLSEKTFQNFKITETGRQLTVSDNDGEELLIIDKEGF